MKRDSGMRRGSGSIAEGIGWGSALAALQFVLFPLLGRVFRFNGTFIFVIAPTQVLSIGAAAWWAFRKGRGKTGTGILIVAAIVILWSGFSFALTTYLVHHPEITPF